MIESGDEAAMKPSPRTIGIVWMVYLAVGVMSGVLISGIVVAGNAAATAQNILAHATSFQASASLDLVANAIYIALTAFLYGLFRRVNRSYALTAAFLSLAGCIVQIMADLFRLAAPLLLGDAQLATAFTAQQLQSATLLGLSLYNKAYFISFPLFALFEMVTGYLILNSRFLPRWLGVWWLVGAAAWLIFLWPPLALSVPRFVIMLGATNELAFAIWLIVKGGAGSRLQLELAAADAVI
jgi:hypothetical protein